MTLIAYTDGSTGPTNPGYSGFGVHGYIYDETSIGKGTSKKPSSYTITTKGYHKPAEVTKLRLQKVSPVSYLDIYGSLSFTTNNVAEIKALTAVFEYVLVREDIDKIHVLADSKYVLLWLSKGLKKLVNTISTTPNRELVEYTFIELLTKLVDRSISITFEHVYGHSEVLGNEYADILANMGRYKSTAAGDTNIDEFTDIKEFVIDKNDYWKRAKLTPDILTGKRLYCIDGRDFSVPTYEGITYDEDDFIGTNQESGYTIVRSANPIDIIEIFKLYTKSLLKGVNRPYLMYLDTLRANRFLKWYTDYGFDCLNIVQDKNIHMYVEKEIPVVIERRTIGIMKQAFEILDDLNYCLDIGTGLKTDDRYEVIEITDTFFSYSDNKKCYLIKSEISSNINIVNKQYEITKKGKPFMIDIPLQLTRDICNRDVLKRLEKQIKSVKLVLRHREIRISYQTVIELLDGTTAIWSSMNMNDVFTSVAAKSRNKPYIFK